MQLFRHKPILAFLLLVVALLALGISLYWVYGRSSGSPFTLPPDAPPPESSPLPSSEGEPTTVL